MSRSIVARGRGYLTYHARRAGRRALERWRSSNERVVSMPPVNGIGVGNMLSFWMWAHDGRLVGEDRWVRRTPDMARWLDVFPNVDPLLIDRSEVGLRDRRTKGWHQEFDAFPRSHFESFIAERLLTSPRLPLSEGNDDCITVNVRRGDYYSNPVFRALYGFDIAWYVRVAVEGSLQQAPVGSIEVVSDDPDWCRANLGFLNDYGRVRYQAPSDGPVENLGQLVSARRLILANSTFSYWAAYMSNVRYGDNYSSVWVPAFHRRDMNDGRSWHLDPRWSVVENVSATLFRGDAPDDVSRWYP